MGRLSGSNSIVTRQGRRGYARRKVRTVVVTLAMRKEVEAAARRAAARRAPATEVVAEVGHRTPANLVRSGLRL